MRSVAVIGASLAGLSAARALRRQGFDGGLTIIGAEAHRPYDRPPLSKEFLAGDIGEGELALELDDENLDARWLLGVHATGLDAGGFDEGFFGSGRGSLEDVDLGWRMNTLGHAIIFAAEAVAYRRIARKRA